VVANHAVSPVPPLEDDGLAEDALEREAEPQGGGTRRRVQRVALPFVAPVPERERLPHHEVHGFGGGGRPLQQRREAQVPDFDRARQRVDAQIAGETDRAPRLGGDDREEERIVAEALAFQPASIGIEIVERPVGQIGPLSPVGIEPVGSEELRRVALGIERLEPAESAGERRPRRMGRAAPIGTANPIGCPYSFLRCASDIDTSCDSGEVTSYQG